MRMRSNGREQRPLAETARADRVDAVAWHPSGREVLFTDDNEIKAVSIETGAVRMVVRGHQFRGLDLATNGILVATSSGHRMHGFDLNTGQYHDLGRGCSANLSPDGSLMSRNTGRHLSMSLQRWADGAEVGSIAAPPGLTIDNEYWSNHPNWIVTRTESPRRCFVFVHDVAAKRAYQVTFEGNGNRPDLHVTWSRSPPRLSRFGFRR
jgi:hypothetical protein